MTQLITREAGTWSCGTSGLHLENEEEWGWREGQPSGKKAKPAICEAELVPRRPSVNRSIQRPSGRLGGSSSNLSWGHPAQRPAANAHPQGEGRREGGMRRRQGKGQGKEKEPLCRCSSID